MTKPNPEKLPPVPKARPSAWWVRCYKCGPVASDECVCPSCFMNAKPIEMGALWGHEWVSVVWMALIDRMRLEAVGQLQTVQRWNHDMRLQTLGTPIWRHFSRF